jgi:hypothetical protein
MVIAPEDALAGGDILVILGSFGPGEEVLPCGTTGGCRDLVGLGWRGRRRLPRDRVAGVQDGGWLEVEGLKFAFRLRGDGQGRGRVGDPLSGVTL